MKLILGSSSWSRQAILKRNGLVFEIISPEIDEKTIRFENPVELVTAIAEAKMDAVLAKLSEQAFVITSDQVVVSDKLILEKPESIQEATEFLIRHRSIPPETVTAVCVSNSVTGQRITVVDFAKAFFSSIPDDLIDRLIDNGRIMSCSGAYIINDPLMDPYVDHIEGTLDSIEGLPFEVTLSLLKQVGFEAV